jgi:hypothetical protein
LGSEFHHSAGDTSTANLTVLHVPYYACIDTSRQLYAFFTTLFVLGPWRSARAYVVQFSSSCRGLTSLKKQWLSWADAWYMRFEIVIVRVSVFYRSRFDPGTTPMQQMLPGSSTVEIARRSVQIKDRRLFAFGLTIATEFSTFLVMKP